MAQLNVTIGTPKGAFVGSFSDETKVSEVIKQVTASKKLDQRAEELELVRPETQKAFNKSAKLLDLNLGSPAVMTLRKASTSPSADHREDDPQALEEKKFLEDAARTNEANKTK